MLHGGVDVGGECIRSHGGESSALFASLPLSLHLAICVLRPASRSCICPVVASGLWFVTRYEIEIEIEIESRYFCRTT